MLDESQQALNLLLRVSTVQSARFVLFLIRTERILNLLVKSSHEAFNVSQGHRIKQNDFNIIFHIFLLIILDLGENMVEGGGFSGAGVPAEIEKSTLVFFHVLFNEFFDEVFLIFSLENAIFLNSI